MPQEAGVMDTLTDEQRAKRQIYEWGSHPIGTAVVVHRDNGSRLTTVTRSHPWVLSGHTAVIMVAGISGCYALERVHVVPTDTRNTRTP
jgi:hypothetical protein